MRAATALSSYPDPLDRDVNPRWLALVGTAVPVLLALVLCHYLRSSPGPDAVPAPAPVPRSAP